jgi:hypothetical protein
MSVDTCAFNVWLCVVRHAIHDTEEAGRLTSAASHISVHDNGAANEA